MIKTGFLMSWLLLAAGDAVSSSALEVGTIAGAVVKGGALVVLAITTYFLFQELRSQKKENKEERVRNAGLMTMLCERWDGWEKIRHEDSKEHHEVLREMAANFAAMQAGMRK